MFTKIFAILIVLLASLQLFSQTSETSTTMTSTLSTSTTVVATAKYFIDAISISGGTGMPSTADEFALPADAIEPYRIDIISGPATPDDAAQPPAVAQYGQFTGTLKLQPVGDGVHMTVLETYSYTDSDGHTLTADPGFKSDGASIPRALWTVVGSPFTGTYLGAAIVHDVGCDTHKYSWQVTHRMFYTAMLRLGVSEVYAKVLY